MPLGTVRCSVMANYACYRYVARDYDWLRTQPIPEQLSKS